MPVTVLLAAKGGAGRTTALKALAAGLLALGRRVLVLDATWEPRRHSSPTTLGRWEARLRADGVNAHDLQVALVQGPGAVLDRLARAAREGWDMVLVDTAAHLDDEAAAALKWADLVVCPFTNDHVAALVGAGAGQHVVDLAPEGTPVRGLPVGVHGRAADREAARDAFREAYGGGDTLISELPWSELLGLVGSEGHLPKLLRDRSSGTWRGPTFDAPTRLQGPAQKSTLSAEAQAGIARAVGLGPMAASAPLSFAELEEDRRAWAACLELACEVLWAVRGLMLQAVPSFGGHRPAPRYATPATQPAPAGARPAP